MKQRFLSAMTAMLVATTSWAQVPKADLLDVAFKADGTAEDVSAMKNEVKAIGTPQVVKSLKYGMNIACLKDNLWGFLPHAYYRVDYEQNQPFRDALKDGFTYEVLVRPVTNVLGVSPQQGMCLSTNEGGGGAIYVGDEGQKSVFTLEANVGGRAQLAYSGVVPASGQYYHVVGVVNPEKGVMNLYVDGVLTKKLEVNGIYKEASEGNMWFAIGADPQTDNQAARAFSGDIALARIYGDVLSTEQVSALYADVKAKDTGNSEYELAPAKNGRFALGLNPTQIEVTEVEPYTYHILTKGSDPYVSMSCLQEDLKPNESVMAFEYKSATDIKECEFFFSPFAAGRETFFDLAAAADWTTMYVDLDYSRTTLKWGKVGEYMRIDPGKQPNVELDIRNVRIITREEYQQAVGGELGLQQDAEGWYQVATAEDLVALSKAVNSGFFRDVKVRLTDHIDMSAISDFVPIGVTSNTCNVGQPITNPGFAGEFDGQGFTISGIVAMKESSYQTSGVFGTVTGTVRNLGVTNYFWENGYSGRHAALAGQLVEGVIENCYVVDSHVVQEGEIVSGLVGGNYGGTVRNCFEFNNVIKPYKRAGSLVGDNRDDNSVRQGKIINCYAQGHVSGQGCPGGYAGGQTNCQDLVSAERFGSGEIAYLLGGSTYNPNSIWRQEAGIDPHPTMDPASPVVVVTLSGTVMSIASDGLAEFCVTLIDEETLFMEETICQSEIKTRYAELIAKLETVQNSTETFLPVFEDMKKVRAEMLQSAQAYAAYDAKIEEIKQYLIDNQDFQGAGRERLESYLNDVVQPDSAQFPNGSYTYIKDNLLIGNESLSQEIAFVQQLLDKAIATGYLPGADVTSMILNADFAQNGEGWTLNCGPSYTNIADAGVHHVLESNARLELSQTVKNLVPGFYEVTVNAAYRADGFNQSYAQNAFFYAGDAKVYLATLIEGLQAAEPAPMHADKYTPITDIDGNTIGYLPTTKEALTYAFGEGLYSHTLLVEVGADSTLTLGVSTPGCKAANHTWVGPFRLTFCGDINNELTTQALDRALACQSERLTTLNEKYPVYSSESGNYKVAPNYSAATKALVAQALESVATATTPQDKFAKEKELGNLMQEVYDTKKVYSTMMAKCEVSIAISSEMELAGLITAEEAAKMNEAYNTLTNAYIDGTYSKEQAQAANPFDGLSFVPSIVDGTVQLGDAKEFIMFAAMVNAGMLDGINAVLLNDIDMAGVNFYIPIGCAAPNQLNNHAEPITVPGFQAIFDGRGHSIKNLTAAYNANYASSGVFGNNSGVIRNLIVDNYTFDFGDKTTYGGRHGAICGQNLPGGLIENCAVINSKVIHPKEIVSGVAAGNYGGTIRACFEAGNKIVPNGRAGMIVGDNHDDNNQRKGWVDYCYAEGFVTGEGRPGGYVGGNINCMSNVSRSTFASGEIAYRLNKANEGHAECIRWKQTIGKDDFPVADQTHMEVLFVDGGYSNYDGVANQLLLAAKAGRELLSPLMATAGGPQISNPEQMTSNCQWNGDTGVDKLLDGQNTTHFHSDASGPGQDQFRAGLQYLQIALPQPVPGIYLEFRGRADGGPNVSWHDTPNKIRILATNTPELEASWKEICIEEYPDIPNENDAYYKSEKPIMLGGMYQYIRLNILQTTSNCPYWNLSEFQLYAASNESSYYDEHPEIQGAADALLALCNAAQAKVESGTVSEQDVKDIKDAIATLRKLIPGTVIPFQGTIDDPIQIASAEDLEGLRKMMRTGRKTYVVLTQDIDMSQVTDWTPLNTDNDVANGRMYQNLIDFDGCGHVIRNFTCTGVAQAYNSFFGILCGDVRNVGFENANVDCAKSGSGILAGYMGHDTYMDKEGHKITSTLYNVWVSGKLNVASSYAGGLIGNIGGPSYIKNCYTNVDITSSAEFTGGLVGRVRDKLTILQAYAAGTMNSGNGIVGGGQKVGTPGAHYKDIVVWNNTESNFGPIVEPGVENPNLPKADLLDVVFNKDGSATDVSPKQLAVETFGAPEVFYSDKYKCNVARMSGQSMGDDATHFYRVNYAGNEEFKAALVDGFTMETTFAVDYNQLGVGAKMFSAMAAGGFGFEITGLQLKYLVHDGGYKVAGSGLMPQSKVYYHAVGVYDKAAQKSRIYINGVLMAEVEVKGELQFPASEECHWIGIGADAGAINGKPVGELCANWDIVNARVYSEPLTQDNVTALWNKTEGVLTGDKMSGISYYDGTNFAQLQQTVVGWGAPWQCDMAEGSYPTFDLATAIDKIASDSVLKSDRVSVYSTDGQLVYQGKVGGMNLKPGIYVIKGDGRTYKMAIK